MDSKYVTGTPSIARFDYTRGDATEDKTQKRLELAAEYLFSVGFGDHGAQEAPILFSALTKKQKLDVVGAYVEQVINDAARTQLSTKRQDEARAAAVLEAESDY